MANPLELGMTSPAPPNPDAGQGNALQQGAPQQQQQAPPPPNHAQTVAALRHMDALRDELTTLINNPSLGKSDMKSQIIDGTTKLVAQRILKPADAVIQLSQVPENPIQQRQWLQSLMMQNQNAERAIIMHHAVGFAGQGPEPTPSADDHFDHIGALQANYGGRK